MILTLTASEMLKFCRIHGGLEHIRTDCNIEQTDGLNPDNIISHRLRCWYLELLDTAPVALLGTTNVTADSSIAPVSLGENGAAIITAPEKCRRIIAVKLSGWHNTAQVLPMEELARVARLQENPYTRADEYAPVAVAIDNRRVQIWPSLSGSTLPQRLQTVSAIIDSGPEIFTFDESMLSELSKPGNNIITPLIL